MESRIITDYHLGKMKNTLSAGIRLYTGTTSRQADGKGTTGTGYDVTITGNYPVILFLSPETQLHLQKTFFVSAISF